MIIITVVDFRAPESLETHPNREVKSNEKEEILAWANRYH